MDRVLFIVPPHLKIADFLEPSYNARVAGRESGEKFGGVLTDMPLGPLSISSYLKNRLGRDRVDVRIMDLNVELNYVQRWQWDRKNFGEYFWHVMQTGFDRVTGEKWTDWSPNIVGTSVLFGPSYDNVLQITKACLQGFPDAVVMAGGGIPTVMYTKLFQDSPELDAIGFAESEIPMSEYLTAGDRKQYLENSPAWITRNKMFLPRGMFKASYIYDLDEIPFYDYDIVRKTDYSLNPALTAYAGVFEKKNNFHYMTSRGCPYRCNFCASHKVNGREMRYHSVERVRQDLTRLRDVHGAKTIVIQDDNFMGQGENGRARAHEIVDIIGELNLTVVFQNSLTLVAVKRDLLESMKRAGVTQLLLSVESGSEKSLKKMHKPLRLDDIERVAKDCRELGIYTDCNILIGNIFETEQDIEESAEFLRSGKCPADWFKIFITTPLPGSELYEDAQRQGYITGNVVNFDFKKANISRPELPAERLEFLQYKLNLELNFVRNHNFRIAEEQTRKGNHESANRHYSLALLGFLSAISAKDNHVFGHHYAALCYDHLGEADKAEHHRRLALQAKGDPFWQKWLDLFPNVRIGATLPTLEGAAA